LGGINNWQTGKKAQGIGAVLALLFGIHIVPWESLAVAIIAMVIDQSGNPVVLEDLRNFRYRDLLDKIELILRLAPGTGPEETK
jgi:hypothetical protein